MFNKKKIIIWANCQGNAIDTMLNKYYSDKFTIYRYLNFEYIKNSLLIPLEFKECDIFIYQNYSDRPGCIYDLSYILNSVLKDECVKICFPYLTFDAIYCYEYINPENQKTIKNHELPFGKFFFGISIIRNYLDNINTKTIINKELFINELIDRFLNEEINEDIIKKYYDNTFIYLENKILNSHIPNILGFIKNNFTKKKLFHNRNHPTGILLNEVVKEIFKLLELHYEETEENFTVLDNLLNDWVMPILPYIKKYYNCNFDDSCSSWYNKDIKDTRSFIYHYINDLYFE